ncbi:Chaperone protein dnaJ [Malassezia vespertilionis]|uniref:J domain-containing protein n=1 Tax=Malassezia vespertilionis TaxID=2020962 RepID=A0A2N1JFL3_9BASI|nr:Chaperone protein dnaJ [Malassezia vespertilionis]PKI85315.1 hypothetical protein MVES_001177 [Malassezia vespertilionis]WFD05917.1 Chaperone protein dnaJ [Malassezia vespertilionis]
MESEEAHKALGLAQKHVSDGNTAAALKWARKSVSIHATPEATALVAKLEKQGVSSNGGKQETTTTFTSSTTSTTKTNSQGNQTQYTQQQMEIVRRVKSAGGDFYRVLSLEKTAEEHEVKKSYKKLALQLHPDKNSAPGADEAFKIVSKAFTVLSDKDKRGAYDRFGGDPDSRYGANAASSATNPFAGFGGGARMRPGMGAEIDPQDLFNMFFGGGTAGDGFGGPMFSFGGGPGFRTQYYRPGARPRAAGQRQQAAGNQTGMWFQLLPVLILLAFSLLSYLPALFTTPDPEFRWKSTSLYRAHRTTFDRGVSYYVDPVSFARHPFVTSSSSSSRKGGVLHRFSKENSSPELLRFETRVEESWMKELYRQCENAQEYKRRRILDAHGFFGFGGDRQKIAKIQAEKYESCEQLARLYHIRI